MRGRRRRFRVVGFGWILIVPTRIIAGIECIASIGFRRISGLRIAWGLRIAHRAGIKCGSEGHIFEGSAIIFPECLIVYVMDRITIASMMSHETTSEALDS